MGPVPGTIGLGALFVIACRSMASVGMIAVSFVSYTFTVLGTSVCIPSPVYKSTGPKSWSFKYINAWESTFVHPAKGGFPGNNSICCLRSPFFCYTNRAACGLLTGRWNLHSITVLTSSPYSQGSSASFAILVHHLIWALPCPLSRCTQTAVSTDGSVAKVCIFATVSTS